MDTSKVKNMSNMCANCSSLKEIPKFSESHTKNVTDISYMFYGCSNLEMPKSDNEFEFKFNEEKIIDMSFTFYGCKLLDTKNFSENYFKINDFTKANKEEVFGANESCLVF